MDLPQLEQAIADQFKDVEFVFYQSNLEGELINFIQQMAVEKTPVVFNPGGYSHTSVALADAISGSEAQVVEVHISNIHAREPFRHTSLTGGVSCGMISGFGLQSYILGVQFLLGQSKS